jgi:alkaline phosphatase D
MIGHVELRTAVIWFMVGNAAANVQVSFGLPASTRTVNAIVKFEEGPYKIAKATFTALEPGTNYKYNIKIGGKQVAAGEVTTQQLWQYRTPAPDFSFLTGSCTYFNELKYDRPGKPYGNHDSAIFNAMTKEKADFMLWLGDNWYTREVDYFSEWGLYYRPFHYRSQPVLQQFLKNMPHYAIWDDHDYGWNNSDKSYPFKETSRKAFQAFWANPSYGENNEGIYTKMTWNDIDVFMMDARYFRSNDDMEDSTNGKPNAEKRMYGVKQIDWLKNALLQSNYNSNISFRIIATGSQVLNTISPADCFYHFPVEYQELLQFIADHKIKGVIFLTGDRHHSEVIKMDRAGTYTLYDITASSITAGVSKPYKIEENHPNRVMPAINENNYTRVSISGAKNNRALKAEFLNINGQKVGEWSVTQKELLPPK